jgi:formylglycine-generating enzyme required for sulfatase activity
MNTLSNKWWLPIILISFILGQASAQQPIERITKVIHEGSWYQNQAQLWEDYVQKHPEAPNGWLEYFYAARYSNMLDKNPQAKTYDLEAIYEQASKEIPNTYVTEFMQYLRKLGNIEAFEHLKKAYELNPGWVDLYHNLLGYYVLVNDPEKAREFGQKWINSGDYSPDMLRWNYNMLMSVENDAILLTWGDNDTYPSWLLQYVHNRRQDIQLMNIHLLAGYDIYRDRKFRELDIPEVNWEDARSDNDYIPMLIGHVLTQAKHPVYLSCGIPENMRKQYEAQLYATGLAFKYSPTGFDNLATLQYNYENRFLKDHFLLNLGNTNPQDAMVQMDANYLPPFIRLYKHYQESGDHQKADQLRTITEAIAKETDREDAVAVYFDQPTGQTRPIESGFSIRELDKAMKPVGNNLYAAETELSNADYEQFMMDLLRQKEYDKLDECKIQKTDWMAFLDPESQNLSAELIFKHGHPDDSKMPVQNISHEAARLYCAWITEVYNQSTDKKKRFKKVRFRLPSESEWTTAAKGNTNSTDAPYSWGGYFVRNSKGCYLGNFNTQNEPPCTDCPDTTKGMAKDGGYFTVPVASYFPNNFGLYNVHGNVAEMVNERGIAMGGSWNDSPADCTVNSKKIYNQAAPTLGFRVFMEVIEK